MRDYLLGIDLGTTNVKALLYSTKGEYIDEQSASYSLLNPSNGWFEQDAEEWWSATAKAIQFLTSNHSGNILSVCVSSQAPTMLPLNCEGNPLRPGLIWMDTRASGECEILLRDYKEYMETYQNQSSPYYILPKILWFKHNEPLLYSQTSSVITTNGYINFKLCDELCWDSLQAEQLTQCYDNKRQIWSSVAESLFQIPLYSLLGKIHQPWETIGYVTPKASIETGLREGTPVLCGSADGLVAPLAAKIVHSSSMGLELGTSAMILFGSKKEPSENCRLMQAKQAFPLDDVPYTISSSVNTAGKALEWFAETMNSFPTQTHLFVEDLESLAKKAPVGSNGVLFMPYLSGERAPLWNEKLRAAFFGLSLATEPQDFARSIYEGTALAFRQNCEEASKEGIYPKYAVVSGGGAKSVLWLKIIASVLNLPLHIFSGTGGAPLADVILAGYGSTLYNCLEDAIHTFVKCEQIVQPIPEWIEKYADLYKKYKAIQQLMLHQVNE